MKKMTCKQLGGACDKEFLAETFEDMTELSKEHSAEMFRQHDKAHLDAMKKMQELMQFPEAMRDWFNTQRKTFEALPHLN